MTTEIPIPNVYQLTNEGTAPKFNSAFAQGCGAKIITDGVLRPGNVALWGEHKWFKTLHKAIAEGRTWYYGDHAYFGRGVYFRVTMNALQCDGMFSTEGERAELARARFEEVSSTLRANKIHDEIKIGPPVFDPKGFVMVCPPSEPLSERSGFRQEEWTAMAVATIKASMPGRHIEIRQKPKVNRTPAPFLQAMQGAFCAVTYTSNIVTEALLGGYPCVWSGDHPADALYPEGKPTIEGLGANFYRLPEADTLRAWAGELCLNQWTLAEIARGDCWRAIA